MGIVWLLFIYVECRGVRWGDEMWGEVVLGFRGFWNFRVCGECGGFGLRREGLRVWFGIG